MTTDKQLPNNYTQLVDEATANGWEARVDYDPDLGPDMPDSIEQVVMIDLTRWTDHGGLVFGLAAYVHPDTGRWNLCPQTSEGHVATSVYVDGAGWEEERVWPTLKGVRRFVNRTPEQIEKVIDRWTPDDIEAARLDAEFASVMRSVMRGIG